MEVEKAVVLAQAEDDLPAVYARTPQLVPIANKPVLFHGLEGFQQAGIRKVAMLVGGPGTAEIRDAVGSGRRWDLDVQYIDTPPGTGVANGLMGAESFLGGEPFVFQQGDALVRERMSRLRDRFADEALDALALGLAHGPSAAPLQADGPRTLPPVGGCFLSARALAQHLEPDLDLATFLARLRAGGGRVRVERVDGCLPCRGGRDALLAANRRALLDVEAAPNEAAVVGSELQGVVSVHPTAEIRDSTIRGPVAIGAGVQIAHAYVGPYTSIGAGAAIEGSEVEDSIVCEGARIGFLGSRLEGSIVGRGARLGRDYRLPQGIRLVVGDGAEVTFT